MVGDYNDETNFQYKLLLIIKGIWKLCKAFANVSSANIKLSKISIIKDGRDERVFNLFRQMTRTI